MREYTEKAMAGDVAGARAVSKTMDPVRRIADRWMNSKWSARGSDQRHQVLE